MVRVWLCAGMAFAVIVAVTRTGAGQEPENRISHGGNSGLQRAGPQPGDSESAASPRPESGGDRPATDRGWGRELEFAAPLAVLPLDLDQSLGALENKSAVESNPKSPVSVVPEMSAAARSDPGRFAGSNLEAGSPSQGRDYANWGAAAAVGGLGLLSFFMWLLLGRVRVGTALAVRPSRQPGRDVITTGPLRTACEDLYRIADHHRQHVEVLLGELESPPQLRSVLEREAGILTERLGEAGVGSPVALDDWRHLKFKLERIVYELVRLKEIVQGATHSMVEAREPPRNKLEAYAALGVNADVGHGTIKKLVTALRINWHPDQAKDENDRRLREERLKEINIAWDLISGKRREA